MKPPRRILDRTIDAEIDAIAKDPAPTTFANTIEALDRSGLLLERSTSVFENLSSAETSDALQAIQKQVAPVLAAHRDDVALDPAPFQRVKAVWDARATLERHEELLQAAPRAVLGAPLVERAVAAQLSLFEDGHAGTQLLDDLENVRGQDQRHPSPAEPLQDLPDGRARKRGSPIALDTVAARRDDAPRRRVP